MTIKELEKFLSELNDITDTSLPSWLVDGAKRVTTELIEEKSSAKRASPYDIHDYYG